MDINEIMKYLPHRYPFLLVDRILEIGEEKIVGIKNVTINEPFFQGHFPGHPIMPGVLIVEAMAQIGGVFAFKSMSATSESKVVYFMGIDNARFRQPVLPGDQIRFELELLKRRGPVWRFKGNAFVDGNLVAEAELLATIADK
jgi:beta-hydroxyacyl-ACP dehydratase FabZ